MRLGIKDVNSLYRFTTYETNRGGGVFINGRTFPVCYPPLQDDGGRKTLKRPVSFFSYSHLVTYLVTFLDRVK
jgi:hypothetical protein